MNNRSGNSSNPTLSKSEAKAIIERQLSQIAEAEFQELMSIAKELSDATEAAIAESARATAKSSSSKNSATPSTLSSSDLPREAKYSATVVSPSKKSKCRVVKIEDKDKKIETVEEKTQKSAKGNKRTKGTVRKVASAPNVLSAQSQEVISPLSRCASQSRALPFSPVDNLAAIPPVLNNHPPSQLSNQESKTLTSPGPVMPLLSHQKLSIGFSMLGLSIFYPAQRALAFIMVVADAIKNVAFTRVSLCSFFAKKNNTDGLKQNRSPAQDYPEAVPF